MNRTRGRQMLVQRTAWRRPPLATIYVHLVIAAGTLALGSSLMALVAAPPDLRWAGLAALTILGGQLMLRMPSVPVSMSISDVFTFTTALMFGPAAGAVVVGIDAAVISTHLDRKERTPTRCLFNVAAGALAMWLAAHAFFAASGVAPLADDGATIVRCLGPLAMFAGLYFLLNTALIAFAIASSERQSPWIVWVRHFVGLWPGYFGGASTAGLALVLLSTGSADIRVLALVLPFPFIVYVTFRTAVGRMRDHVGHLTHVNSMHLATIETLAQAVDARDAVTHDHIRRVQQNAMRLARELGSVGAEDLKAIEAAALLHDTGKLAIPEHILNKPDKLSPIEFETMKLHATIGAEILSPIAFPFPVVPIVRHHHENWDGTGYPDGLRGEAIPIGARIISVVDCLDALTSDRPYRRAMSAECALDVIRERSGIMYDPAVVAALLRIAGEMALPSAHATNRVVETVTHARQAIKSPGQADPVITPLTVNIAGQLGRAVGRHLDLGPTCDALHAELSTSMPDLTAVVFQHDTELDSLIGRAALGAHRTAIRGLAIAKGSRLTGWVAAHRTAIVNSDAALDLGDLAATLTPPPRFCFSTPIVSDGALAGVLTIYSTAIHPFAARDVALFEMLASLLAPVVAVDNQARIAVPADFEISIDSAPGVTRAIH